MNARSNVALPIAALSFLLLSACGDVDRPLKTKLGETERATAAVQNHAPDTSKGWRLFDYAWKTAHPYANREHQVFTITHDGAASMKVHFRGFHTESGYDWVKVSAIDGSSAIHYSGRLGDFWSEAIAGSTVRVEFSTDASVSKHGFDVVGFAAQQETDTWNSRSFVWETGHPYRNDEYQVVEISEPAAVRMKLRFAALETEKNYDFVRIYDESGRFLTGYTGNLGGFETPAFTGKKLYLVFESDYSVTAPGVRLAGYSFVPLEEEPGCFCPTVFEPVCGENGKTYSNSCAASCEEAPVKHAGECGTQGDFCGGIAGLPCADGWRCELEGGWPDAGGVCVQ